MSCNCKKNKRVAPQVIMGEPEPLPEQIVELTQEEIEDLNNIDITTEDEN